MRKLWFAHLARALIAFPGGFGTLDELTEILTLAQTRKLESPIPVILYGSDYWREIINFEALVRHGMIDSKDLELFQYADDPVQALALLQNVLPTDFEEGIPAFCTFEIPRALVDDRPVRAHDLMDVTRSGKPREIIGCRPHVLILQAAPKPHEILVHVMAPTLR